MIPIGWRNSKCLSLSGVQEFDRFCHNHYTIVDKQSSWFNLVSLLYILKPLPVIIHFTKYLNINTEGRHWVLYRKWCNMLCIQRVCWPYCLCMTSIKHHPLHKHTHQLWQNAINCKSSQIPIALLYIRKSFIWSYFPSIHDKVHYIDR